MSEREGISEIETVASGFSCQILVVIAFYGWEVHVVEVHTSSLWIDY